MPPVAEVWQGYNVLIESTVLCEFWLLDAFACTEFVVMQVNDGVTGT